MGDLCLAVSKSKVEHLLRMIPNINYGFYMPVHISIHIQGSINMQLHICLIGLVYVLALSMVQYLFKSLTWIKFISLIIPKRINFDSMSFYRVLPFLLWLLLCYFHFLVTSDINDYKHFLLC